MNLYELTGQMAVLERQLQESPDEELEATLAQLQGERNDKFEAILYVRKNYEALMDAADAEIKRMKDRKEWAEKRVESLEKYIAANLKPDEKYVGKIATIKFGKSKVVESNNMDAAPIEFIKYEPTIMKQKIKDVINAGGEVPGWWVRDKLNLNIK